MPDDIPTTRRSQRHPPMPVVPAGGCCRWCAAPILHPDTHKLAGQPNMRRRWCSESLTTCVRDYMAAAHQGEMRKALWKRDKGVCAGCGARCGRGGWDADHRIPLWSTPAVVPLSERHLYWGMGNYQTLCGTCHGAKTAAEAAERAAIRKAAKAK